MWFKIHTLLQPNNIKTLCNTIIDIARENDVSLVSKAQEVSVKFIKLFTLFAECHSLYDESTLLSSDNIKKLGTNLINQCVLLMISVIDL